jgi:hypothetical protein
MPRVRIAFDPGVRTGWAMMTANVLQMPIDAPAGASVPVLNVEEMYDLKLTSGTIRTEGDEQVDYLERFLDQWHTHDTHVVIESFDNRIRHVNTELVSLQYIGAIKLWCRQNKVPYTMQTPSQGKAFFTDDKLTACGVLSRPLKQYKDANDAMRHLLTNLMNTDPLMRVWCLKKLQEAK